MQKIVSKLTYTAMLAPEFILPTTDGKKSHSF